MVTEKLCFRLLPIQILLAVIGAFNGIVTSLFASNFIGQDAMSAVGLFAPISTFIGAVSTMLLGGSQILRIKDDCVPFNPADRRDIVDPEDITQNIGVRMVYSMAESVQYQNILGLNVLTIRMSAQA